MQAITEKQLEALCARINRETGNPLTPYTRGEDGKLTANPGCYFLDNAYGGVRIVQMANEKGGQRNITDRLATKRETWEMGHMFLKGFLKGIETAKQLQTA